MLYNLLQANADKLDRLGLYSLLQVLYQLEFRAFAAVLRRNRKGLGLLADYDRGAWRPSKR